VCRRLQIKGERRRLLLFLVDNHLLMYRTATQKSLEDPAVIEEFASIVRTRENLDTLLVMTYADSKGTSDKSWTGYKEASIRQLYSNTLQFMKAPADFMRSLHAPLDELRAAVLKKLGSDFEAEVDAHFQHMPASYFNFREAESVIEHVRQFREFFVKLGTEEKAEAGLLPIMQWEDHPEQGYSDLTVVCWDRHLLLARVAGALAAQSINILSADFFRRGDHLVLDIFRVCTTNFTAVSAKAARQRVEASVKAAFLDPEFNFSKEIAEKRAASSTLDAISAELPQRVYLNNHLSPDENVLELQVLDRLGLLHDVFMAVGRLGLGVTHARINTEKGAAIDTIYVQDEQGRKLTDKEKLDELAKAVSQAALQDLAS
jgi:[protein-PII] uridylyltransferase